jgi:hypothetical protein
VGRAGVNEKKTEKAKGKEIREREKEIRKINVKDEQREKKNIKKKN